MAAHDTEPSRLPRGVACARHVFAAHIHADPRGGLDGADRPGPEPRVPVRPGGALDLVPGDPIEFRLGGRAEAIGRVLHARSGERLSYLLQAGPGDPPVYLTWRLRSDPGGCTVRLEVNEVDNAGSAEDAEDIWLPVLARLQILVNSLPGERHLVPGGPPISGDPQGAAG